MDDRKLLLELARGAAERACQSILEVYNNEADFDVEIKSDQSPLTRADRESHRQIAAVLHGTGIPILSEEGRSIPFEERKQWKTLWIVDPLDGTKEFVKRNGDFTVNIALVEDGVPVLGVVAIPVEGSYYVGGEGLGVKVQGKNETRRLSARPPVDFLKKNLKVVASRSHMDTQTANYVATLAEPVIVSRGSSLKFMMIAEGQADVYPRFAPTMEWDTAAPHALLLELGHSILQVQSHSTLQYNKADLRNPGFLCF